MPTTEQLFLQFRKHGDAEAMGRVFDRTAPKLLILAMHMVRDASVAEDLVQSTFVAAIEGAHRYRPSTPLLSWLARILSNRAKAERRAMLRRQRLPERLGAEDPEQASVADPLRLIAGQDARQQVVTAVDGLAEPYRTVVVMRVVHGMGPAVIAHTLGRAPGTVRMQLQRGLEMLRRSLPKSLVLPAALLAMPDVSLAAARAAVMARAVAAAATATSPVTFTLSAAAVVLVLCLGLGTVQGWLVLGEDGSLSEDLESEVETGSTITTSEDVAGRTAATTEVRRAPLAQSQSRSSMTLVSGRVVAAEDDTPIAGARVKLRTAGPDAPENWPAPEPCVTGADGRYALRFVPPSTGRLFFRIEAADRGPVRGGGWPLRPGVHMDHGDVKLQRVVVANLRVIEDGGVPVAGHRIRLQRDHFALRQKFDIHPAPIESDHRSNAEGWLPATALYPGRWRVDSDSGHGWQLVGPKEIEVLEHEPPKTFTIRLARPAPDRTISGRVEDTSGRPVAGLGLVATPTGGVGHYATTTRVDGRFFFRRMHQTALPFRLSLNREIREYRLATDEKKLAVRIGATDQRIVVQRLDKVAVYLRVVAAETGQPIPRFAFSAQKVKHRTRGNKTFTVLRGSARLGPMQDHNDGQTTIRSLFPGDYVLYLRCADAQRADVLGLPFRLAASGPLQLRVEVPHRVTWRVRVQDPRGRPVAHSQVELVTRIGKGRVSDFQRTVDAALLREHGAPAMNLVVFRTKTGKDGVASLVSSPALGTAALRIHGARHEPKMVRDVTVPARGKELNVTVNPAARIVGRLTPSLLRVYGPTAKELETTSVFRAERSRLGYPQLRLQQVPRAGSRFFSTSLHVHPDGTFRFDAVPPGDYQVWMYGSVRQADGLASVFGKLVRRVVNLQAGEERAIVIDPPHLNPVEVRGTALLNGRPAEDTLLRFNPAEGVGYSVRTAANGAFLIRVLPDRYLPRLSVRKNAKTTSVFAEWPVDTRKGSLTGVVIRFQHRPLRLKLATRNGKPIARRLVSIHAVDHALLDPRNLLAKATTDDQGRAIFDSVPNCRLAVRVWGIDPVGGVKPTEKARVGDHFLRLGTVQPPADGAVAEVRLVFAGPTSRPHKR